MSALIRLVSSAILLVGSLVTCSAASGIEEYEVVTNGETVGSLKVQRDGKVIALDYFVDNNGRGPKHHADISLNKAGMPLHWKIQGNSMMGGKVDETFDFADQQASWLSQADTGKVSSEDVPLYIVNDNNPWIIGLYARVLLTQPDWQMSALPGGQLRLEKLEDWALSSQQTLGLYQLIGLSMQPDYLLLDTNNQLFAQFNATEATIRKGYTNHAERLQKLAGQLAKQRAKQLQQQLGHHTELPLRIVNVHIFSPVHGTRSEAVSVQVKNGHITRIEPWQDLQNDVAEKVFDGEGGTLIPGLHDMHTHNSIDSGLWYLAAGITTTRDMGNDNSFLLDLIPRINNGEIAGPRIVRNGFIEGRSPFSARDGFVVESAAQGIEKVRWYKEHGYWQIKLYNSINPDWVPAIADEAHQLGLSVTGHIPAFSNADNMIAAGYDEITHINQLMLGWLLTPDEDTRTPLRLTAMVRAANLELDSAAVQKTLNTMQQQHIAIDPTAVILERLMLSRAHQINEAEKPYLSHMPISYQRFRKRTFISNLSPELDKQYQLAFDKILDVLGLMQQRGILVLPGTDDGTGFALLRELELYVRAGFTPAQALRSSTWDSANYLQQSEQLGSIETGKRADFVLLKDNPLQDISAIRSSRMVVKDQFFYFPAEIYQALGVKPFNSAPPLL